MLMLVNVMLALAVFVPAASAAELINVSFDVLVRTNGDPGPREESLLDGPYDGNGGADLGTTWNQPLAGEGWIDPGTIYGTDLKNSTNGSTTVDFTTDSGCIWAWGTPDLLMLTSAIFGWDPDLNPYDLIFSGLAAGTKYDLYIAGFHPGENGSRALLETTNTTPTTSPQIMDNGGGGGNDSTWVEGENYVLFEDVLPDSSGEIIIHVYSDWTQDSTKRAYVSGWQLMSGTLFDPIPPDGATVPVTFNLLQWTLPEPNDPVGGTVSCDVWFTDNYPNYGQDPNNPDFTNYATKIVDNDAVGSKSVTLAADKTYYWRIDIYDSSLPEPPAQPFIGPVFIFNTSNVAPVVDAGEAEPTWLVDGTVDFDLLGELVEDDGRPVPATFLWTVTGEPSPGAATIITDPTLPGITVTATEAGTYELTLTADDTEYTDSDTVSILIYENECVKMKEMDDLTPRFTDLNGDCVTDVLDVAIFAGKWLLRIDESL